MHNGQPKNALGSVPETSVSQLLGAVRDGSAHATGELYALLYPEIKRLARSRLYVAGGVTSLNTTALVNEGFLRMADREGLLGDSRAQFFAYVGRVLRSVVLDHLRERAAEKRGGDCVHVTLSHAESYAESHANAGAPSLVDSGGDNLFLLDVALEELKHLDLKLYELVELRYFAGLSVADIAAMRGVATRTIDRDWVKAKTLLETLVKRDA